MTYYAGDDHYGQMKAAVFKIQIYGITKDQILNLYKLTIIILKPIMLGTIITTLGFFGNWLFAHYSRSNERGIW